MSWKALCFCAEYNNFYPLHFSLQILLKHFIVVSRFSLFLLVFIQIFELWPAHICVSLHIFNHNFFLLNLLLFPFSYYLLINEALVFYFYCVCLVFLPDNLHRNRAIFPLSSDSTCFHSHLVTILFCQFLSFLYR